MTKALDSPLRHSGEGLGEGSSVGQPDDRGAFNRIPYQVLKLGFRADQATARAHRIGQTKTVFVHRILVKGTLEERIDWLLERKRGIADDVIGGVSGSPVALTREELLEVLRPLDDQSGAVMPVVRR